MTNAPIPELTTELLPGWRAGIGYYRISDDPEHDELGVRRQRKEVREKAEREQIHLVAEYVDDDRSAYKRRTRPDYERFLAHAGSVDVVMAWHPDRMTRGDLIEIERLIVALGGDEGTPIITCTTGDYDVSTPHGRMIARVTGSIARYESEHKSTRTRAKMKELAEAGKSSGGRRAFGYRGDQLDPDEAPIVRELIRRVLAGESMRSLAADLNRRGIRTSAGNEWRPGPLRDMLAGTRIVGLRTHHGRVVAKGLWPAIIDEATHRRVVATLAERVPVGRRGRTPWLLTGFLRCCHCGAPMIGNTDTGSTTRRYICRKGPGYQGCGHLGIKGQPLEDLLGDLVTERLADVDARRDADAGPDDSAELDDLSRIAAMRIEASDDRVSGALSRESYLEQVAALDRRQRIVETRLAGKVRTVAPLDFVVAEGYIGRPWKELGVDEQRMILAAMIDHVTVGAASVRGSKTFEAARITAPGRIAWKV